MAESARQRSMRVYEEDLRRLREECVGAFFEDNPGAKGLAVTDAFMFRRVIEYYVKRGRL